MSMATGEVYALLADGSTVEIRPARPDDFDAVKAMHQAMSPNNTYLRFFNISRMAADREARRICRNPAPGNVALLALVGHEVVGVASYVLTGEHLEQAEVAFAVADHMHDRGIATLLLEHLVSYARSRQIVTFKAETLTENKAMLKVFADAGLPVERRYADGLFELTFPLPTQATDSYLDVVAERERRAEVASLRHVFAPESVAVIGASRRRGTVGRAILDNIRAGGYAGRLYTVNPRARQIGGERCLSSALDLPEPVDLAVVAVPAATVLDVAEQCGQRGVRSLVVITAGLHTDARADLLAVCRRHGMRLVGPGCFGVAVPGLGLDATFAVRPAKPGVAGLVMQSGGLGFAMVDHVSRLGIGISSFASVGDKLDVSGNDMLMWWAGDGLTKLALLSIEQFGNPRKFARTARRVSGKMPVLTVLADRSDPEAPPLVSREALFEQAGVITTRGFGELIEAAALLATQPVPAGRNVAIVSNVGSAGALAADACTDLGLTVHHPAGLTKRKLRALIPGGAVTGPVDATAPVSAETFRRCLELLAPEVDAIVAIVLPTGATGDLEAAIGAADVTVPLVAAVLTQPESVRLLGPNPASSVPVYGSPEAAVRALAHAAGYGAWRAGPRGHVPAFADIRTADARALVRGSRGWLGPGQTAGLLRCYGIPLADLPPAGTEVTVTVADDRTFGPLVTLDSGDTDRTARFTPLTDVDAAKMAGSPYGPLGELLLRVSRLADDLPEVTDLELRPVVAGPDGVAVVNARVKVAPYEPQDPFLRKLR
jgi:acyl-CoA synthetase (NDP forming)/GNAT superfamily N-acetyltransferase